MRRQVPKQAPIHPGLDLEIRTHIFVGKKVVLEYPGKIFHVRHSDSGLDNSFCSCWHWEPSPALWPRLRVVKSKPPPFWVVRLCSQLGAC